MHAFMKISGVAPVEFHPTFPFALTVSTTEIMKGTISSFLRVKLVVLATVGKSILSRSLAAVSSTDPEALQPCNALKCFPVGEAGMEVTLQPPPPRTHPPHPSYSALPMG